MTTTVVWTAGQKPQRVRNTIEAISGVVYHYRGLAFGYPHRKVGA